MVRCHKDSLQYIRLGLHDWCCRRGPNLRLLSELIGLFSRHDVAGLVVCFFRQCARLPRPTSPGGGGLSSDTARGLVLLASPQNQRFKLSERRPTALLFPRRKLSRAEPPSLKNKLDAYFGYWADLILFNN